VLHFQFGYEPRFSEVDKFLFLAPPLRTTSFNVHYSGSIWQWKRGLDQLALGWKSGLVNWKSWVRISHEALSISLYSLVNWNLKMDRTFEMLAQCCAKCMSYAARSVRVFDISELSLVASISMQSNNHDLLCWCCVLRRIWCWWCYSDVSDCVSTPGKLQKYAWPRWGSDLRARNLRTPLCNSFQK
jgi:hypothetical protein